VSQADHDATAARSEPLAASGEDTELLCLCADFHRLYAAAETLPLDADETLVIAALARRWDATDSRWRIVSRLPPLCVILYGLQGQVAP
jgi:hypothetical protein